MSSTTVAEFANELKKSTATLLEQLKAAGVAKSSATDRLTDADKHSLLNYLQSAHGTASAERKKITLVKKSTSEIKQADSSGKARTIQVEVRKKRTFVRRDDGTDGPVESSAPAAPEPVAPPQPAAPVIDHAELARREEEARRQAELIRRQEEELAQKRQERQEQEARARAACRGCCPGCRGSGRQGQGCADPGRVGPRLPVLPKPPPPRRPSRTALPPRRRWPLNRRPAADEEAARAADLSERVAARPEAEAAAIRNMMSTPKKVLVAKRPEEVKPVAKPATAEDAKAGVKGTLHKPAAGSVMNRAARPGAPGTTSSPGTGPGAGKEVKSAKLSSSWAGDPAKKKAIPTRGDTGAGAGRGSWRGGPRGKRGNDR